jgi:hypothetical protein
MLLEIVTINGSLLTYIMLAPMITSEYRDISLTGIVIEDGISTWSVLWLIVLPFGLPMSGPKMSSAAMRN